MQRPDSPATLEEGPRKDKGYRRYASNVERALSLFDTALQEWADYIAFLGRLLKALQSKPSDSADIPHKTVVAKRLAQCLAPTLPSGVHQKTLEVYAYLFSVLGKDGLSKDLPLWLPGLSPTLSFASLSVKPALLSLFETFIVPLKPSILRSALKAIVLALLPGLEEATSEEFERTLLLLKRFRKTVSQDLDSSVVRSDVSGDQIFWQSLFLASITSSNRRQGALAYLIREFPNLGHTSGNLTKPSRASGAEDVTSRNELPPELEAVASPEPGLLVRCFAAGLQDDQLLIQRGFLDLLVTHLPLHSAVFYDRVVPRDLDLLVMSAASVVARREMSLNRRLWTWFLGPQSLKDKEDSAPESPSSPDSDSTSILGKDYHLSQKEYFQHHGLEPLIRGILKLLQDTSLTPTEKTRPFRICLSLMDRWEIGGLVVPRVFLPAMECMWRYQRVASSTEGFAEVLRSANVFFDGIESSLIWSELTQMLIDSLVIGQRKTTELNKNPEALTPHVGHTRTGDTSVPNKEGLDLVYFIISKFNVREEEMLTLHIPLATVALLVSLRYHLAAPQGITEEGDDVGLIVQAFKITVQLVDMIPSRILAAKSLPNGDSSVEDDQVLQDIQRFYTSLHDGSGDGAHPIPNHVIRVTMSQNASKIITGLLDSLPKHVAYIENAASLLEKTLRKVPGLDDLEYEWLMSSLAQAIDMFSSDGNFATVAALVSMLECINRACPPSVWNSDHRVRQILPKVLDHLWTNTSPSRPRHNVEAVRCLWRLHWISPDRHLVEGSVAALLFRHEQEQGGKGHSIEIEGARRFATLWAHSHSYSADRGSSIGRLARRESENAISKGHDPLILQRPLLLLLDSLSDQKSELFTFVTHWLQSLSNMQKWV